tara:strand:+ start:676 stop:1749 length:1074 start_codon:yes stop_codon:yes gene_type:complete
MRDVLKSLSIKHFRNITSASLQLSPGVNIFCGDNAAGKTSVLEAVYLLSHGRSFRTTDKNNLINRDADHLFLDASLRGYSEIETKVRVLKKTNEPIKVSLNDNKSESLSSIIRYLPAIFMGTDFHRSLIDSPAYRRRLINWALFHVEHSFHGLWMNYQKSVRQRNALLKRRDSGRELHFWEEQICSLSSRIFPMLDKMVQMIDDCIATEYQNHQGLTPSLTLNPGWDMQEKLSVQLKASRITDMRANKTSIGCHRFDIDIMTPKGRAKYFCSEGEMKHLAYLIIMAVASTVEKQSHKRPIFLLDDWASELDNTHGELIADCLLQKKNQILLTSIRSKHWTDRVGTMFHVKHGEIIMH